MINIYLGLDLFYNLFYYQILTSMRNLAKKQSTEVEQDRANYKELYLQCKKNVAIFMKHVDNEMSQILKKHECEKKKLQAEIDKLKEELKQNASLHYSKASTAQSSTKKTNSESKVHTQASISKETVEECLSKFNNLEFKSRKTQPNSQRTIKSTIEEQQKQNLIPSTNFNEDIDLGQLKLLDSVPRRDKRLKEKKMQETGEKVQNIKDFLKDIRGRLSSRERPNGLRERQQAIVNVISPELFSSQRNKNY